MTTIFWDFENCSCVPVSPWEISLVGYGKGLTLKMGSLGSIKRYAEYFDENHILKGRNRLVNFDIYKIFVRIGGQLTKSCFSCFCTFLSVILL